VLAIVDTGCANLASVAHALERLEAGYEITDNAQTINRADRVILPGVGALPHAMEGLKARGLVEVLQGLTRPVLGICLGMQILFSSSEEGDGAGLGILPEKVGRLKTGPLPLPHMGWNRLEELRDDPLLSGIAPGTHMYFVHSYAVPVGGYTLAGCHYGAQFSAIVRKDNFWGCQFHPERSGRAGAQILANFLEVSP